MVDGAKRWELKEKSASTKKLTIDPAWSRNGLPDVFIILRYGRLTLLDHEPNSRPGKGAHMSDSTTSTTRPCWRSRAACELLLFFFAFGIPTLGLPWSFYALGVTGLVLYTAAFVCEAERSGINAVAPGQAEAARAIVAHAFATLPVDRLICLLDPGNVASRAVAVKIGITLLWDHYVDEHGSSHVYAIDRPRPAGHGQAGGQV